MNEEPLVSFQANLQRGRMLRVHGRYTDAEKFLQSAVAADVSRPEGYYELAFCYCNWGEHDKQALETIDRAISLDPNQADFFALRAWILGSLDKDQEAVQVAEHALAMDSYNILALNACSRAYIGLHEWENAETNLRRTLALDAHNEVAANLLAVALRQQGRLQESQAVTHGLLSRTPEDASAQANAGWSALHRGDYRRANRHFLEALRLQPDYASARSGLIHAFNSRVWIYRLYFQYIAWMSRHKRSLRYLLVFGIYVVYRVVCGTIRAEYGSKSTGWIIVIVALYFIIFGFGRSFGNLFLLLDRFVRHALTTKEKILALLVGFAYSLLIAMELMCGFYGPAAVLLGIAGFFVWSVLFPRLKDLFSRRREEEEVSIQP